MTGRPEDTEAPFIWATRGRAWGFRFLRRGGFEDPLLAYEDALSQVGDDREGWNRGGDTVALRFPDPEGRQDESGRAIPHDFVLFGTWAEGIDSLEAGRQRIWPEVAEEFARIWDHPDPPGSKVES